VPAKLFASRFARRSRFPSAGRRGFDCWFQGHETIEYEEQAFRYSGPFRVDRSARDARRYCSVSASIEGMGEHWASFLTTERLSAFSDEAAQSNRDDGARDSMNIKPSPDYRTGGRLGRC
jgi:hypothetical protein